MNDQICDELCAYIGVYKYAHDLYSNDERWKSKVDGSLWNKYVLLVGKS